ncbi:MAG: N-6 DNA methylase [Bacteroidales bacterium]|nr:N-6 DNA methylase [Candidatus Scybalocola fimicaballi]
MINTYAQNVSALFKTGVTTEHSFRGYLQTLLESLLPNYMAVNEPKRSACGAPDYALIDKKNKIPYAYVEAKDLFDNDLRGVNPKIHKEQFDRYKKALSHVCFTDYLEFHFYVDGEAVDSVCLLEPNSKGGFNVVNEDKFISVLQSWADCPMQKITSASRLAEIMAHKAQLLKESTLKTLETEENSEIHDQFATFKQVLINDLTEASFADIYAQTIAYGMFAARLHDKTPEDFSRQEAATLIPTSNPFLRRIFQNIAGFDLDSRVAWIVDDLAKAFAATDMDKVMGRYRQNALHEDPLIHFYEDFLAAYDKNLRKSCGVYYTPQSVVRFIVRAVDNILIRDFDFPDGLADDKQEIYKLKDAIDKEYTKKLHRVQILDPATGTGTFLAETVRQIYKKFEGNEGMWPSYVESGLRPRLNGFELLMAPYTIAHLKLDMLMNGDENAPTSNNRTRIFLTNSLEEHHRDANTLFAAWLSDESRQADSVKRDCPVMVMMGNPPYSVSSHNDGDWIRNLLSHYKKDLNERNIQPLSDDYIKFIRLGQHFIEKNGQGVLGYISNNSYLDGLIHRQMRKTLLDVFDDIYIVNLHGNSKRKETAPDGGKDENVFDIMVGTNIGIFVKRPNKSSKKKNEPATVHYLDLYGARKDKYDELDNLSLPALVETHGRACQEKHASNECPQWKILDCPAPNYFFVPKDFGAQEEYEKGLKIDELFKNFNSGIKTQRDDASIFIDEKSCSDMFLDWQNLSVDELKYKYGFNDVRDWQVALAKNDVLSNKRLSDKITYRPFDNRVCIYTGKTKGIMGYPRYNFMKHMFNSNICLTITRQTSTDWRHCLIIDCIADMCTISARSKEGSYLFPLYLYDEAGGRHLNIKEEMLGGRNAEEFFAYIYAVLHSPSYREKYKEFLKIDFPRIPQPTDEKEYKRLVDLGNELIDLHLMRASLPMASLPKFPKAGSNEVEIPKYVDGCVWINNEQYFSGVSETAWGFYVGGYQPAQKWLKDRKSRTLSLDDIRHYQKIIAILDKTAEIMKTIG